MKALLPLILLLPLALQSENPIRVQLTTGGHPHDMSFYGVFEGQKDLAINVNPHPSAYRRDLRKTVDVLVQYDMVDLGDGPERNNLQQYLEAGRGLVVLHHAICSNWQWKWWYEEVVGSRYLKSADGPLPRSTFKHDETMNVRTVAKHPVLEGVGPMRLVDETYKHMWFSPKVQVLMETDNPTGDKPVVWISPYEKSRVIVIQLGHGAGAHNDPGYRRLVHNAILWAAGS